MHGQMGYFESSFPTSVVEYFKMDSTDDFSSNPLPLNSVMPHGKVVALPHHPHKDKCPTAV